MSNQELSDWYHDLEIEWQEKIGRLTTEELLWWLREQEGPVLWDDYVKLANANIEVAS